MDSLTDLLQQKRPPEPPQLAALRAYVLDHHATQCSVAVTSSSYYITIPNASLATVLRMEMPVIQQKCQLDKKLFIRIGVV